LVKVKTSIYVDRDLWEKFKRYARSKGFEASRLLEEIMREQILEDKLVTIIDELSYQGSEELDFEPIKPHGGFVSSLIRRMRDERNDNIFRQ